MAAISAHSGLRYGEAEQFRLLHPQPTALENFISVQQLGRQRFQRAGQRMMTWLGDRYPNGTADPGTPATVDGPPNVSHIRAPVLDIPAPVAPAAPAAPAAPMTSSSESDAERLRLLTIK